MGPRLGRCLLLALLGGAALPGASPAATGEVLELSGGSESSALSVFGDSETGELVLRDPGGIESPGDPCEPPSGATTIEVRCPRGAVAAIVGSLGVGDDSLTLAAGLAVRAGASVDGRLRAISGGPGQDRLRGARRGDLLLGGAGPDLLLGGGGDDLLRGGDGADRLLAGPGADAVFGGSGADLVRGGPGPDLCRGGHGRDRLGSCSLGRP